MALTVFGAGMFAASVGYSTNTINSYYSGYSGTSSYFGSLHQQQPMMPLSHTERK